MTISAGKSGSKPDLPSGDFTPNSRQGTVIAYTYELTSETILFLALEEVVIIEA